MLELLSLALALIFDLVVGEPPKYLHPTVWFGRLIAFFDRNHPRNSETSDMLAGAFFSLMVIFFALALSFLPSILSSHFASLQILISAYLLKTTFSIRALEEHVGSTAVSQLEAKRGKVSLIVSRDSSQLTEEELNSAAIESLAENLVDSIISPIFFFLLLGLPGAMVYRAVNTLDAMIGYKNERYKDFGKFAAKLDDLLNFIPARISVILFVILFPSRSRKIWRYYRMARFKLNGDKPISAMSAVLGIRLEKRGSYSFPGKKPSTEDILSAINTSRRIWIGWLAFALAFLVFKTVYF